MLVLALFFMVVVGLLVSTLVSFTTEGLSTVSKLRSERTVEYAAQGATDLAIQTVRYSSSEYVSATPAACSPGSQNVVTIASYSVKVYCSNGVYDYYSLTGATRTITFTACPTSEASANCVATSSFPDTPLVTAVVVFDDFSSTDVNQCSGSTTATCGTGMTIEKWIAGQTPSS